MTRPSKAFDNVTARSHGSAPAVIRSRVAARCIAPLVSLVILLVSGGTPSPAADAPLRRGTGPYSGIEYTRVVRSVQPATCQGNARAQARLGFMYENGFSVPQNYAAAADLYQCAAAQGDAFAQSRLGLSYDKGHGVPQNMVLSYKWLDLAAARATNRERDYYRRLRDAVASKMTSNQIVEGQRLALIWAAGGW